MAYDRPTVRNPARSKSTPRPAAPSGSRPFDPWFKIELPHSGLGARLKLGVPHDVFSTQRIDEGTLLLLAHLPERAPNAVLDLGCGYGALGLPIAAKYPQARVEMVDRDLLAAQWSGKNAAAHGLSGVEAYGSLGYRDLKSSGRAYDWILCNVPARIGKPFIRELLLNGLARLTAEGELRVVVINDLVPVLEEIRAENAGLELVLIARGPRHSILGLRSAAAGDSTVGGATREYVEPIDLYLRDQVTVGGLALDRPFDLGGDDPRRLQVGLPILLDALPRVDSDPEIRSVFCFRSGYGQLPLIVRTRWPQARVVAVDRDLLATTFTRRNAARLGLEGDFLEVRDTATCRDWFRMDASGRKSLEQFDLVLGELSSSAGEAVAHAEVRAIAQSLAPGGQAQLLCSEKLYKEWLQPLGKKGGPTLHPLLMREAYAVVTLRRPRS